uniref:Uncharacterized protein n=1 Tax=Trichogramma kaykai TaxID=54128 RepID=A0ABD2XQP8_9HYME
MCILTLRDLRPANLEKGQEMIRLRFYSAYAWGGPLIVAGLAAFFDHLPETPGQTFLRPRFGEKQCWFYEKWQEIYIRLVQSQELDPTTSPISVSMPAPLCPAPTHMESLVDLDSPGRTLECIATAAAWHLKGMIVWRKIDLAPDSESVVDAAKK